MAHCAQPVPCSEALDRPCICRDETVEWLNDSPATVVPNDRGKAAGSPVAGVADTVALLVTAIFLGALGGWLGMCWWY